MPIFSIHVTVALVDVVGVVAFAIVVEDEVSFVCRVDAVLDWFVSFGVTVGFVAFVAFVAFDILFFVGEVEVGFDVVVNFPLL